MNEDLNISPAHSSGNSTKYSYDEIIVGEWVDGRHVYRKVVKPAQEWYNGTRITGNVDTGIQLSNDIDLLTHFECLTNYGADKKVRANHKLTCNMYVDQNNYHLYITISAATANQYDWIFIIEYVKRES